jgi:hypothetical protein
MAFLIMLLIIAGCAAYLYFKGALVNSFVLIIAVILAGTVAFAYFESLANVFVSRSANSKFAGIVAWAQPLSFVLLFVLVFAVLQSIFPLLMLRKTINLGIMPERVGRISCGIILGFMSTGLLFTVLTLSPLSNKYPYQRFDSQNPDPQKPSRSLFNADGFTAGWFSLLSSGSFSGTTSFAALHPGFIDQSFLNRLGASNEVLITNSAAVIELLSNAVWPAPENLKDTQSNPVEPKTGCDLTIVRIGFKKSNSNLAFTPSQLRLICRQKSDSRDILVGRGKNSFPIGYFQSNNQLEFKKSGEKIILKPADYTDDGIKWIDFAFYVPSDSIPVLVEFRQNEIAKLPSLTPADQTPQIIPFSPPPPVITPAAEQKPDSSNTPDSNKPSDANAK